MAGCTQFREKVKTMKINDIKIGMRVKLPGRFKTDRRGGQSAAFGYVKSISGNYVYVTVGITYGDGQMATDTIQYSANKLRAA